MKSMKFLNLLNNFRVVLAKSAWPHPSLFPACLRWCLRRNAGRAYESTARTWQGIVHIRTSKPITHNPNSFKGSDFFVFYDGKAVFGVIVKYKKY